uniref:penicillin-binding protein 1A n=1 Tax=Flavobacterium sp. TaxID=239 RepID=UPI00404A1CB9
MAQAKNTQPDFKKYIKRFWIAFFSIIGSIFLMFFLASLGVFGEMPTFRELENPDSNLATEIIASDGVTLGRFYSENRSPIKYEDLPQHLVDALVATEDERYYTHSGVDAKGTLRAVVKLGSAGGASTITQQLAKNLFHGSEGSKNIVMRIIQKAKEWIIATKLERQYTKNEIIAHYLNTVDFVNNAFGIRSAANVYFKKEPRDLTIEESAILVGMLKGPSMYNPKRNPIDSKARRNVVLGQMLKNNFIEQEAFDQLKELPIKINFNPASHKEGTATYFREYLREFLKNWVTQNKKLDGSEYNIYSDGLKIYTTIDSKMQQYAEESVKAHLTNLQEEFFEQSKKNKNAPFQNLSKEETDRLILRAMKTSERWKLMKSEDKTEEEIIKSFDVKRNMTVFSWQGEKDTLMTPRDSIRYYKHFLQTGVMSMEPQTGNVKVWVGGINYRHFQYDHVGVGARQVGSTFKPFVYATAINEMNLSPCDTLYDGLHTIPKGRHNLLQDWTPKNSNNEYTGIVTLKTALAKSLNTISAKLIDRVGPQNVVDMAHKLGVKSDIPNQPSIALGAVEITVEEMVAAYATFANKGVYVKPHIITRIEDKNGTVLYEPIPESRDVLSADIAYAVVKLLEGVTENGSGGRLRYQNAYAPFYKRITGFPYAFKNPIAGKTGTTQNQSDGWFMGMVPNLVTGVWVGNQDRAAHFRGITYGQGATMALPIWGMFMKKCYEDKTLHVSQEEFEAPEEMSIRVDCNQKVIDSLNMNNSFDSDWSF